MAHFIGVCHEFLCKFTFLHIFYMIKSGIYKVSSTGYKRFTLGIIVLTKFNMGENHIFYMIKSGIYKVSSTGYKRFTLGIIVLTKFNMGENHGC